MIPPVQYISVVSVLLDFISAHLWSMDCILFYFVFLSRVIYMKVSFFCHNTQSKFLRRVPFTTPLPLLSKPLPCLCLLYWRYSPLSSLRHDGLYPCSLPFPRPSDPPLLRLMYRVAIALRIKRNILSSAHSQRMSPCNLILINIIIHSPPRVIAHVNYSHRNREILAYGYN